MPPTTSKKAGKAKAGPRNEGTDPTWAFKPPPGRVPVDDLGDSGDFDWDTVNNDEDLELCLIRVPDAVKSRYLQGLEISLPASTSKSVKVGSLKKKHATFDVWSMGTEGSDDGTIAGEEINTLTCLLPRKKKGKLVAAPRSIAHRLVLSAQPVTPSAPAPETLPAKDPKTKKFTNPPRPCYPDEFLTHSFKPYGFYSAGSEPVEESMDVDILAPSQKDKKSSQKAKDADENEEDGKKKERKSKKRKTAPEEPVEDATSALKKKSKKVKTS